MNARKYYKIEDKADQADIMIYGVIGESWFEESVTARQLVTDIRDLEKRHSIINIHINSPGGSVFDGLAIFNALQQSKAEVHTWNDGLAASMAAVILMAGSKVHAAKNSLTMLHSPSTGVFGNARDIRQSLNALDKVQNSLIECMLAKSKKTRDEIQSDYFDYSDHWLSAEEAMEEGFVDEIAEKKAAVSQQVTSMDYQEMVARFSEMIPEAKRRGKLVAFFENIFTENKTPEQDTEKKSQEMDIKTLQGALSLSDAATETEVLDSIKKLGSDMAATIAARDTALKDLEAERQAKAQAEKELEELKKAPGAETAKAETDTDKLEGNQSAETFTDALSYCFGVLKK